VAGRSAAWESFPASNIGDEAPSSKAVHGSAPDSPARAWPTRWALIMSGVMMLQHLHEDAAREQVAAAYDAVLREGKTLKRDREEARQTGGVSDAIMGGGS